MVERLGLFAQDPTNKQLRNHALYSPFSGSYGIDTTGDYRAIYELVNGETALLLTSAHTASYTDRKNAIYRSAAGIAGRTGELLHAAA